MVEDTAQGVPVGTPRSVRIRWVLHCQPINEGPEGLDHGFEGKLAQLILQPDGAIMSRFLARLGGLTHDDEVCIGPVRRNCYRAVTPSAVQNFKNLDCSYVGTTSSPYCAWWVSRGDSLAKTKRAEPDSLVAKHPKP